MRQFKSLTVHLSVQIHDPNLMSLVFLLQHLKGVEVDTEGAVKVNEIDTTAELKLRLDRLYIPPKG